MTSKKSVFNMTRNHILKAPWMVVLSMLGNILSGPMMLLLLFSSSGLVRGYFYAYDYTDQPRYIVLNSFVGRFGLRAYIIIALIGAFITALGFFHYVLFRPKTDLYHSLPLSRKELFLADYLAGFLVWAIPFLISVLLLFITGIVLAGTAPGFGVFCLSILKLCGIATLSYLAVYHLVILAIMLSGNILNTLLNAVAAGIFASVFYLLMDLLFDRLFETYITFGINIENICWLSPLVSPFYLANTFFTMGNDAAVLLVGMIIVTAGCLIPAYLLYLNRKSELSGTGSGHPVAGTVLRILVSVTSGLIAGYLFDLLQLRAYTIAWLLFSCILTTVFVFTLLCAMQERNIKAVFRHRIQLLITTLVPVGILLLLVFDAFGYDRYLPAEKQIASMEYGISGLTQGPMLVSDKNDFVFEPYKVTDVNLISTVLNSLIHADADSSYSRDMLVKVTLKSGYSYYRRYRLHTDTIEAVRLLIEDNSYMAHYNDLMNTDDRFDVRVTDLFYDSMLLNDQQIMALREAYARDLKEHWSLEELTTTAMVGNIQFTIVELHSAQFRYVEYPINYNYTHTLDLLTDIWPDGCFAIDASMVSSISCYAEQLPGGSFEDYFLEGFEEKRGEFYNKESAIWDNYNYYYGDIDVADVQMFLDHMIVVKEYSSVYSSLGYQDIGSLSMKSGWGCSLIFKPGTVPDELIEYLKEHLTSQ